MYKYQYLRFALSIKTGEQTLRMDSHNIEIEECLSLSKPLMRPKQKGKFVLLSFMI